MNPLERLENLATELLGRGAAISLDPPSKEAKAWVGTAWNPQGSAVVQASGSNKGLATRALIKVLRERSIDQPVEPWACWTEGCYLAVDEETGCCEMHGLPPEEEHAEDEEDETGDVQKGEEIDWGYED